MDIDGYVFTYFDGLGFREDFEWTWGRCCCSRTRCSKRRFNPLTILGFAFEFVGRHRCQIEYSYRSPIAFGLPDLCTAVTAAGSIDIISSCDVVESKKRMVWIPVGIYRNVQGCESGIAHCWRWWCLREGVLFNPSWPGGFVRRSCRIFDLLAVAIPPICDEIGIRPGVGLCRRIIVITDSSTAICPSWTSVILPVYLIINRWRIILCFCGSNIYLVRRDSDKGSNGIGSWRCGIWLNLL